MTPADLEKADPALFAECVAIGVTKEHTRTIHLLDFGAKSADEFKLALANIRSGAELTPALVTSHYEQVIKKLTVDQRQAETDDVGAILDGVRLPSAKHDAGADEVAAELSRLMGPPPIAAESTIR